MCTDRKKIDKASENSTAESESQKIYVSMALMFTLQFGLYLSSQQADDWDDKWGNLVTLLEIGVEILPFLIPFFHGIDFPRHFFTYHAASFFNTRVSIIKHVFHAHKSRIRTFPFCSESIAVPGGLLGGFVKVYRRFWRTMCSQWLKYIEMRNRIN